MGAPSEDVQNLLKIVGYSRLSVEEIGRLRGLIRALAVTHEREIVSLNEETILRLEDLVSRDKIELAVLRVASWAVKRLSRIKR
jgi:sulfur carrier protein ThiS